MTDDQAAPGPDCNPGIAAALLTAEAATRLAAMSDAERRDLIMAYAGSLYMTGMDWSAAITMAQMEANELLASAPEAN